MRATVSAGPDTSELAGRVKDLGGGGVKVETLNEIPEGTPVILTLWTPWGSVTLGGKVVWRHRVDQEAVHGFMFDVPIGDARARQLYEESSAKG
jgi:hypothetical protein